MFAGRWGNRAQLAAVLCASGVFYAAWDPRFLALLAGSILTNFAIGVILANAVARPTARLARHVLCVGITVNLLTLGLFKYANFFVSNLDALTGTRFFLGHIILPLGISFFTFEQIGYLVDIRRGTTYRPDLLRYAVFVSFFPRLVAGPILRYSEIVPQLETAVPARSRTEDIAVGLTIFAIGLAKKAVLADGVGIYVGPIFGAAASGNPVDFFVAWAGALAYTCQLYFDFSGYSDMAIGTARCFGIRFPMNFNSPYKSSNIIEFWRRWHMTLSRFLRDYLYISLGGNKRGRARRYLNLMLTMLLGGLWHGANWTFVAWGGMHGLYLIINHGWHAAKSRLGFNGNSASLWGPTIGTAVTFVAVVCAWVFFRAPTFASAANILEGMIGLHGATIPAAVLAQLPSSGSFFQAIGVTTTSAEGGKAMQVWIWILALLLLIFLAPNTQEIMAGFNPVLEATTPPSTRQRLFWQPNLKWAIAGGAIAFLGVVSITRVSEFLYWQF